MKITLKPKIKIQYNVNKDDKWKSDKITKKVTKALGKNRHWWNIKNIKSNEESLNLEQIYDFEIQQNISPQPDLLQQMPRLSLENVPTDTKTSQEKKQIHKTLLLKNKFDNSKSKQVELNHLRKEGCLYTKHINEGQNCISLRRILKEKVANSEKLVKAR